MVILRLSKDSETSGSKLPRLGSCLCTTARFKPITQLKSLILINIKMGYLLAFVSDELQILQQPAVFTACKNNAHKKNTLAKYHSSTWLTLVQLEAIKL